MVCIYICVCLSFVLGLTVGSRVSLSHPNLISVESANIVAGRYAYTMDLLQLDRFTDASNPPLWSVQCLQPWLSAFGIFLPLFQYFDGHFSFLIFLTGVTSNSTRWEVVKISVSPKRPFFYTY